MRRRAAWKHIRPQVKEWTLESWARWEEEEPTWFTKAFRAQVDDDMIPPDVLERVRGRNVERALSTSGRFASEPPSPSNGVVVRVLPSPSSKVAPEQGNFS